MPSRTIRRARSTVYAHRWVCPKCGGKFAQQTKPLVGPPTCNHGHTSITMEPLIR